MEHGAWSEEPEIRGQQSENDGQRITDNSVCRLPFTVYDLNDFYDFYDLNDLNDLNDFTRLPCTLSLAPYAAMNEKCSNV